MDKKRIEAAVREILAAVGEDPDREGLVETPARVARMYEEIFSGLEDDPKRHVKLFNEEKNEEMVIVRDIPMYSMCEHHLLPFIGRAHIAYIPRDGKVIGLSKLARIVDSFARRPQLQERLTSGGRYRGGAPVHDDARSACVGCADENFRSTRHDALGREGARRGNITSDKIRRYYGEIYF